MKRIRLVLSMVEDDAQATVEYAVTLVAVLAIIVGCAAIWRAGSEGVLARLVQEAASHVLLGAAALDNSLS